MDETTKKYLNEKFERVAAKEDLVVLENRTKEGLTSLESRMATKDGLVAVEGRLASTFGDVVTLIDHRFDKVDERFDAIEEKLDPLVNQVSGHEKRVAFLEDRVLH